MQKHYLMDIEEIQERLGEFNSANDFFLFTIILGFAFYNIPIFTNHYLIFYPYSYNFQTTGRY